LPYHQAGGNSPSNLCLQTAWSLHDSTILPVSSPSLTLSPLIVTHLPHQKDALLSHFAEVGEALYPSTTLITKTKIILLFNSTIGKMLLHATKKQCLPTRTKALSSTVTMQGVMHHMV